MSISLPEHLLRELKAGRAILVTGAGASATTLNRTKKQIKQADKLAEEVATAAGYVYSDEGLSDVIEAARPILGDAKLKTILEENYLDCRPSNALSDLTRFTWRRIYTFNVDDTLRNIPRNVRTQRFRFYNALKDRREDPRGYAECQCIYLHGNIADFSTGFVFSVTDYSKAATKKFPWYERARGGLSRLHSNLRGLQA